MTTVYLHGMPGSPRELALFRAIDTTGWLAPDRSAPRVQGERLDVLTDLVREGCGQGPVRLVGFSLGACTALEIARRLPAAPLSLHLVSAAAPLESGAFLDDMAGKAVFAAALQSPQRLSLLVRLQSGLARGVPGLLARMLFASAQGNDRLLAKDPAFRRIIADILRDCLAADTANYRAELTAYVRPWAHWLGEVRHPVTLWHGTRDTWAPPAMADALERLLPNVIAHHRLQDLSHYSALGEALMRLTRGDGAR